MNKFLDKTFIRFVIVGLINTCVGTGTMFVLYNFFHYSYWISSAGNYVLGSIVSYFLNKHFTFRYKGRDYKVVIRFILNILVCYLLAYGIAKPLVFRLMSSYGKVIRDNAAMLVGAVLFVILNYSGQRFFTFRKGEEE